MLAKSWGVGTAHTSDLLKVELWRLHRISLAGFLVGRGQRVGLNPGLGLLSRHLLTEGSRLQGSIETNVSRVLQLYICLPHR